MKNNYNILMNKLVKALLILFLPFFSMNFFSCSRAEPQILYGFIELVYYPGRAGPIERYSFFILPEDDDGLDNLEELILYHDREGLRWLFTYNDWIRHEEDGKTWIGTRSIAMRNNAPLPRGVYRAVLVNKGGENSERSFTFDAPEISPHEFPILSVEYGQFHIETSYPINHLIGYDQHGNLIQVETVTELAGDIRNLRFHMAVRTIALWAEDPILHISALTDAVSIR